MIRNGSNCSKGNKGGPWNDVLPLEERMEEMVSNMHNIRALHNRLEKCISDRGSTTKCAVRHRLFDLLGYDALLSRNGVSCIIIWFRGENW